MLIEFSVANYRSFKDLVTLSMLASSIKEHEEQNTFLFNGLRLLKSAAIYGANASGKSNLIRAMSFMRKFILRSSTEGQIGMAIPVEHFRLSTECDGNPSFFEIIFIHNDMKYRYGFESDQTRVYSEWLFSTDLTASKAKESKLFYREKDSIRVWPKFRVSHDVVSQTRPNALFLSVSAQYNSPSAAVIFEWFSKFNIISGLEFKTYINFTLKQTKQPESKKLIAEFIKLADLDITGIQVEENDIPAEIIEKIVGDFSEEFKMELESAKINKVFTHHKKYNHEGKQISTENFELHRHESDGTQKFLALAGPVLDTILRNGILIVDELDARFHPLLTRSIIRFFHQTANAQLVFNTHDTNLLQKQFFRRDQIWFTEKDKYESTDLYSLVEYKLDNEGSVRKDASYGKDYIAGKYGAIPFLGDFSSLIQADL